MINMHSKYDNMHNSGINYALKCINNIVINSKYCILLVLDILEYIFLYVILCMTYGKSRKMG